MRGKVRLLTSTSCIRWITPAYAGKSRWLYAGNCKVKDHPRLCGEKQRLFKVYSLHLGSPPPMRGKVNGSFRDDCAIGITPAYAGKRKHR